MVARYASLRRGRFWRCHTIASSTAMNPRRAGSSISPYWRRTMTDEGWREVKRQWLAEQEQDVP